MTIDIPPELEAYVQQELATGAYRTREELIRDALSVFRDLRERHETLRADVARAIAQAERGEACEIDIDELIARGTKRLAAKGITD